MQLLKTGLSLTQVRVASDCPQSGDFQRGSLSLCPLGVLSTPPGHRASPQGWNGVEGGVKAACPQLGLQGSTSVKRAGARLTSVPFCLEKTVSYDALMGKGRQGGLG